MSRNNWPLIDDEDPATRLLGVFALVTGAYWLIAPLIVLSEFVSEALTELFEQFEDASEPVDPAEVQR